MQNNILNIRYKILNIKGGFSALFVVIIILVAIVALVMIFAISKMKYNAKVPQDAETAEVDQQVRTLRSLDSSDEVGAIDQDITSTNLDNLDQGMAQVDKELSSF